jgi:FtsP/CotA-like multicopper oxidase with cupredoxin domain
VRSDEQVEKGLHGALVVSDPNGPDLGAEQLFVLDDVWLDEAGQPRADTMMTVMLGRQGNLLLVNGRANPVVAVRPGERRRWRLVNAANARYFRVALPGASLVLLGSEGGLVEAPQPVDEVLLSPGERVDLAVEAPAAAGPPLELVHLTAATGSSTRWICHC